MIVCLESGGTKLVAALADQKGQLKAVARRYRTPEQEAHETLAQLVEMAKEIAAGTTGVQAVSYGFGGTVTREGQRPGPCFHESGWDRVNPQSILTQVFGVPVFIENDCNLAALGEAHFGVRTLTGTLFYMTLGTGIGGGIVHEGRLLQAGDRGEGEIGHVVVDPDGPQCPCGNRGCLETLCSGPGLATLAQRTMGAPRDSPTLMHLFRNHDPRATEVVNQAAGYLGLALGAAINLLAPRVIVLGGGVMTNNAPFLELIKEKTQAFVFPVFHGQTQFRLSVLGENVVCQGAAVHALQQLDRYKETVRI